VKEIDKKDFALACIELNVILSNLPESERNKIPEHILSKINRYRSNTYTYKYDYSKTLKNQEMLPLTRLLLFNIYNNYLNTNRE